MHTKGQAQAVLAWLVVFLIASIMACSATVSAFGILIVHERGFGAPALVSFLSVGLAVYAAGNAGGNLYAPLRDPCQELVIGLFGICIAVGLIRFGVIKSILYQTRVFLLAGLAIFITSLWHCSHARINIKRLMFERRLGRG